MQPLGLGYANGFKQPGNGEGYVAFSPLYTSLALNVRENTSSATDSELVPVLAQPRDSLHNLGL